MLLPYRELDCPHVDQISSDVWEFINQQTDVMTVSCLRKHFTWNFIDVRALIVGVTSLDAWFRSLGLRLRDVAATVTTSSKGLEPHKDEPPVVAKINFPVFNTRDTWNIWWDDHGREIARIQMLKPMVFNASITHGVEMGQNCTYPRVVLSCMFIKEPKHLLEIP